MLFFKKMAISENALLLDKKQDGYGTCNIRIICPLGTLVHLSPPLKILLFTKAFKEIT